MPEAQRFLAFNFLEAALPLRGDRRGQNKNRRPPPHPNQAQKAGMQKRMGCKADGEAKYRSNLLVVRILARHPTQQTAFSAPRLPIFLVLRHRKRRQHLLHLAVTLRAYEQDIVSVDHNVVVKTLDGEKLGLFRA